MEHLYLLIRRQFPDFVQAQYPTFIEFIKYYYKWLGENYTTNYDSILDIDQANEQFLRYYRSQLDVYGLLTDDPNFKHLKFIKEFYSAKGTEQGLLNILRIVYNDTTVSIQYPSENILRASNSVWYRESFITVQPVGASFNIVPETINSFYLRYPDIDDIKVDVIRFEIKDVDNIRLYFRKSNYVGITENQIVDIRDSDGYSIYIGEIIKSPSRLDIIDAGQGWQLGQIFRFTGSERDSLVKVTAVDSNGGITRTDIIRYGLGHTEGQQQVYDGSNTLGATATVEYVFDVVTDTVGKWLDDTSKVSNPSIRLEDNFYYQQFSYDVLSELNPTTYKSVAELLHPSGTKLFTTFVVNTNIGVVPIAVTSFPFIRSDLIDNVYIADTYIPKEFTKFLVDVVDPLESIAFNLTRPISESVSVTTAEGGTAVLTGAYAASDYFAETYSVSETLLVIGV